MGVMIDGGYSILYIKWVDEFLPIGCLTSDSFSEEIEMLETTTRDNGGWKTSTPTNQNYNISFDGIFENTNFPSGDNTKISLDRLRVLKRNRTLIEWKIIYNNSKLVDIGKGYLTSLSRENNIDEFISFSANIEGYGSTSTSFVGAGITDFDFYTAVDLWFTDQPLAEATYGLIGDWNVSTVTNMSEAFYPNRSGGSAVNTFNEDISNWDTSSVENMSFMFRKATAFNQPLSWDTSSVLNMEGVFYQATSFNQPLNWDVSSVESMRLMFGYATTFNQPLNWDTSNVITMDQMFSHTTSFNQDISSWDTSLVKNMEQMFYGATSFNQPLNFDTGSVTTMHTMFRDATAFNQPLNWGTSSVTNMQRMFQNATAFNQPLNWDTSSVINMYNMFDNAGVFNQPLNFDTSSAINMQQMFSKATAFNQPLNWDVSSVISMSGMFQSVNFSTANYDLILVAWEGYLQTAFPSGVGYTPNISVSFNTTQYTGGSAAATARASLISNFGWTITDGGATATATGITDSDFYTAVDLWFTDQPLAESTYGLIGDWNVSQVTNMSEAFSPSRSGGSVINTFNEYISSWDTSSVTNMAGMFLEATSFNQPLNWNTSSVTNMQQMFQQATSFNQPLTFDTSSVTTMQQMFFAVTLSTANYDLILVYWESYLQTAFPSGIGYTPNISVSFGSTPYTSGSAAETARTSLINNFGWTITDGGSI